MASVLGPAQIEDPLELVKGGSEDFGWLLASVVASEHIPSLRRMLEVYAAKTLCERSPSVPSGFLAACEKAMSDE